MFPVRGKLISTRYELNINFNYQSKIEWNRFDAHVRSVEIIIFCARRWLNSPAGFANFAWRFITGMKKKEFYKIHSLYTYWYSWNWLKFTLYTGRNCFRLIISSFDPTDVLFHGAGYIKFKEAPTLDNYILRVQRVFKSWRVIFNEIYIATERCIYHNRECRVTGGIKNTKRSFWNKEFIKKLALALAKGLSKDFFLRFIGEFIIETHYSMTFKSFNLTENDEICESDPNSIS